MRGEPRHIITQPDATIKRIVDAVGENQPGDTLQVEIETEDRLSRMHQKLHATYPHSQFMIEDFKSNGTMWAYIYIKKKARIKRL